MAIQNGQATDNYKIPDTQIRQAVDTLADKVEDIRNAKTEHFTRQIRKEESGKIREGIFVTDSINDGTEQKRLIVNIGGKLYHVNLSEL